MGNFFKVLEELAAHSSGSAVASIFTELSEKGYSRKAIYSSANLHALEPGLSALLFLTYRKALTYGKSSKMPNVLVLNGSRKNR